MQAIPFIQDLAVMLTAAALVGWGCRLLGLSSIVGFLLAGLLLRPAAGFLHLAPREESVWLAAQVDEDWQAEMWGEDDLATQAQDAHRADFMAGARFLALLQVQPT